MEIAKNVSAKQWAVFTFMINWIGRDGHKLGGIQRDEHGHLCRFQQGIVSFTYSASSDYVMNNNIITKRSNGIPCINSFLFIPRHGITPPFNDNSTWWSITTLLYVLDLNTLPLRYTTNHNIPIQLHIAQNEQWIVWIFTNKQHDYGPLASGHQQMMQISWENTKAEKKQWRKQWPEFIVFYHISRFQWKS